MEIEVVRCTKLDADRAVAHVRVGPLKIGSLWIVGRESGRPRVSWPETGRGHPIVECEDEILRDDIEQAVLAELDATPKRPPRSTPVADLFAGRRP